MNLILVMIMMFGVAMAGWNEPIDIYKGKDLVISSDLYTSPSSNKHHVLAVTLKDRVASIEYWQIDNNGAISNKKAFSKEQYVNYWIGSITGYNNTICVVISARHNVTKKSDLLFSESLDDGNTWSDLIIIPHENDKCERGGGFPLFIMETGRLYVFFHVACDDNETVYFVTKPPFSQIFSQEKKIHKIEMQDGFSPSIAAEYTAEKTRIAIHVFWAENGNYYGRPLMRTNTTDNGITWSDPEIIGGDDSLFGHYPVSPSANRLIAQSTIIVAQVNAKNYEEQLLYSRNRGTTFTKIVARSNVAMASSYLYRTISTAICGTEQNPILFWMTQETYDVIHFSEWDLNTMTPKWHTNPFVQLKLQDGIRMSCVTNEAKDKITVTALGPGLGIDGNFHVYFAQYETKLNSLSSS